MDNRTNNSSEKDELSGRISDALRDHAEPYCDGAWERFETRYLDAPAKQPARLHKRRWQWSAASVLLLGAVSWWIVGRQSDSVFVPESLSVIRESPAVVLESVSGLEDFQQGDSRIESAGEGSAAVVTSRKTRSAVEDHIVDVAAFVPSSLPVTEAIFASVPAGSAPDAIGFLLFDPVTKQRQSSMRINDPNMDHPDAYERLAAVVSRDAGPEVTGYAKQYSGADRNAGNDRNSDKWDVGLALASAVTSERLNFGTGVSLAYRLSERISIGSGIGIGRLGVNGSGLRIALPGSAGAEGPKGSDSPNKGPTAPAGPIGTPGAVDPNAGLLSKIYGINYTRHFLEETSELLILDVPFDITYAVSDRFYASAGLSLMQVLQESRTAHFVERANHYQSVHDAEGFEYSSKYFSVDQPVTKRPLQDMGYSGFMNVSLGHKIPLSKRMNFSVEPFFKLPIGKISRGDMNLTHGGVRIVTGF